MDRSIDERPRTSKLKNSIGLHNYISKNKSYVRLNFDLYVSYLDTHLQLLALRWLYLYLQVWIVGYPKKKTVRRLKI